MSWKWNFPIISFLFISKCVMRINWHSSSHMQIQLKSNIFSKEFLSVYISHRYNSKWLYDEIIKNVELTSQILHVRYFRFTIIPKQIRVYGICIIFMSWTCSSAELISYHSNLIPDFSTQMSNLINVYPKKQIALLRVFLSRLGLTHIPSIFNSSLS